jgi:hypothetical protein
MINSGLATCTAINVSVLLDFYEYLGTFVALSQVNTRKTYVIIIIKTTRCMYALGACGSVHMVLLSEIV